MISFACSVGIDMSFNSKHHHAEEKVTIDHHGSHHNEGNNHYKSKDGKDNCCNDSILQFAKLDKTVTATVKVNFNNTVFVAAIDVFYLSDILSTSQVTNHIPLARWCFPIPPDIRVSIQSFQI